MIGHGVDADNHNFFVQCVFFFFSDGSRDMAKVDRFRFVWDTSVNGANLLSRRTCSVMSEVVTHSSEQNNES